MVYTLIHKNFIFNTLVTPFVDHSHLEAFTIERGDGKFYLYKWSNNGMRKCCRMLK